jgi:FKBP-type peptidyl-prolyl cis-trans isomerase
MKKRSAAFAALVALAALATACNKNHKTDAQPETQADIPAAPSAGDQGVATEPTPPVPPTQPAATPAPPDLTQPPKSAKKTASGLVTRVLAAGTGKTHPGLNDRVMVDYTGWTQDGHMFDSSAKHGQAAVFGVSQVIPGWTEGLQLMVEGEKRRMWIPANLAYGSHPPPGAPSGELVFDVKLDKILTAPKAPPVPTDLKHPPKTAKKTASGLLYEVLKKGTGKAHPTANDTVTVDYSGWTLDGHMFDSSVTRGQPATFPLAHVIKGWTEGVQLMVVGEKARFWIPADLAYGVHPTRPGAPSGELVFDIELLQIQ